MAETKLGVVGGKINYRHLPLSIQKKDSKDYEVGKVITWLNMLNEGKKPKRWNKPNKNGTAVTFETISDQGEYDMALGELQGYMNTVNREYGTDLKFKAKN